MTPTLGKSTAGPVALDVRRLIDTRLLVQSNSGGGKSWLLRRILEQTAGRVQQVILDTEGEFSTLREKYDFVICAPQGADAVARPDTAALLARRIRETRVSAIVDLYDLTMRDRRHFVRLFLEELIEAPKSLWHQALIVVDEAQLYCPEKGEAESAAAVIDLASRGRKRGLCALLATQRLSKLHKDAAAEMLNKLIGRTGLDVDVKRAADELGMTARDAMIALRNLDPGEFYAFGPAISKHIVKLDVGQVATTHPKTGARQLAAPPPPSDKIKKLLAELADLPKEAEQAAHTLAQLKTENQRLKRELAQAKRTAPPAAPASAKVVQIKVPAVGKRAALTIDRAQRDMKSALGKMRKFNTETGATLQSVEAAIAKMVSSFEDLKKLSEGKRPTALPQGNAGTRPPSGLASAPGEIPRAVPARAHSVGGGNGAAPGLDDISGPQQRILHSLFAFEMLGVARVKKEMLAAHSGASPRSSAYTNNLGRLRTLGHVDYPESGFVCITETGRANAGAAEMIDSLESLHGAWFRILPRPQADILSKVIEIYPGMVSKERLAAEVRVSPSSSAYTNNLGRLRTLGALTYPSAGMVRAADMLFPEALR